LHSVRRCLWYGIASAATCAPSEPAFCVVVRHVPPLAPDVTRPTAVDRRRERSNGRRTNGSRGRNATEETPTEVARGYPVDGEW